MKESDFAVSESERQSAASQLAQTETTNAVNTGLVASADNSTRSLGFSGTFRSSIDSVSRTSGGRFGMRNRITTLDTSGRNAESLNQKQLRRIVSKGIYQESGEGSPAPAHRQAKAIASGIAAHKALEGSELEGADEAYYKAKGAARLTKKAARRIVGKGEAANSSALGDLSEKKYQRRKKDHREILRKIQSKRNQAAAMGKAAEAKAAAGAGAAKAAAGSAAASSGGSGILAAGASGCLLPLLGGLLVFILFVALLSSILGGSSNTQSASLSEVEIKVAQFFRDKGLDDVQIAGIMGNMKAESGMDPAKVQEGGGGRGICQWDGGRRDHLFSYAAMMQVDWTNLDLQLKFFWEEDEWKNDWSGDYTLGYYDYSNPSPPMGTHVSGSKQGFLAATDVADATEQFCYGWERAGFPRINERIQYAEEYYRALQSGLGASDYVSAAIGIANDDSHGYSQRTSDGGSGRTLNPDVDCSSLVYYALLNSGYSKEQIGSYPFSTYSMPDILPKAGFTRHSFTSVSDLQPGDILLRDGHTEIYIGNGKNVGAHSNYDGKPGDSSGNEVDIGNCGTNWASYYRNDGKE